MKIVQESIDHTPLTSHTALANGEGAKERKAARLSQRAIDENEEIDQFDSNFDETILTRRKRHSHVMYAPSPSLSSRLTNAQLVRWMNKSLLCYLLRRTSKQVSLSPLPSLPPSILSSTKMTDLFMSSVHGTCSKNDLSRGLAVCSSLCSYSPFLILCPSSSSSRIFKGDSRNKAVAERT
jgi:hypothetical protein